MPRKENERCLLCAERSLREVPGFRDLPLVTSDCKPWRNFARLFVCGRCGLVQKAIDASWRENSARIYEQYTIYYQSGGAEQAVFDSAGAESVRSEKIMQALSESAELPRRGDLLEVGCGIGAFFRVFGKKFPEWKLHGTESTDKRFRELREIPEVVTLHRGDPWDLPGTFDLVCMIHVLEHIPEPVKFLRSLAPKLTEKGCLLIEIPEFAQNPFDLAVADHSAHFSRHSARRLLAAAGYGPISFRAGWIPKEITILCRPDTAASPVFSPREAAAAGLRANRAVEWLHSIASAPERIAGTERQFGVFGTSIAAMWLYGRAKSRIDFFVDEDSSRVGKSIEGKPILSVAEIPEGSDLFLCMAPGPGRALAARLDGIPARIHLPPLLEWNPEDPG